MTTDINKEDIFDEDAAFNEAEAELMSDDTLEEDTADQDDLDTDNDDVSEDETEEEVSEDEETDDDPVEESADVDYKALYGQMAAHNAALQNNLEQVNQQFRSWQGRVEAEKKQQAENPDAKKKEPEKFELEMTPELEEFFEMYPSVIPQVQKLIDSKVSTEVSGVEERVAQLIEQQVKPIASRVQESEAQAHERAILEAHPDIRDQIASGAFRDWVESLPAFQQVGAQRICESGSASEVIDLFNNFKESAGAGSAKTKSPNKQKANPKSNTNANKLKAALGVSSEPTPVSNGAAANEQITEDLNAIFKKAEQEVLKENSY